MKTYHEKYYRKFRNRILSSRKWRYVHVDKYRRSLKRRSRVRSALARFFAKWEGKHEQTRDANRHILFRNLYR